jgi:uncharacterized membrane protein YkoI
MRNQLFAILLVVGATYSLDAFAKGRGTDRNVFVVADDAPSAQSGSSYEPDQDRALSARKAGRVLSLSTIIERHGLTGRVVGVKFVEESGTLVYELSVLGSAGQVRTLRFDASTGAGL